MGHLGHTSWSICGKNDAFAIAVRFQLRLSEVRVQPMQCTSILWSHPIRFAEASVLDLVYSRDDFRCLQKFLEAFARDLSFQPELYRRHLLFDREITDTDGFCFATLVYFFHFNPCVVEVGLVQGFEVASGGLLQSTSCMELLVNLYMTECAISV